MIILDTNILSEFMRPKPDERVIQWFVRQDITSLHITIFNEAEIMTGIALLPEGKRKKTLFTQAEQMLAEEFNHRILPANRQTAAFYVELVAHLKESGVAIGFMDVWIAALARQYSATVATRNSRHFEPCGIPCINPWLE